MAKYTNHVATSYILLTASVGIIGWLSYLAVSLPDSYDAHHWNVAWVGFDIIMVINLLITSFAILKRRQLAVPTAMVSGTLLVIDSWFDVVTAKPGWDFNFSCALAVASCLFAFFLFRFASRAIRKSIQNAYKEAGKEVATTSLWKTPLMIYEKDPRKTEK